MYNTIGVNTDPLTVQLYFDENNSIKWKIIFKSYNSEINNALIDNNSTTIIQTNEPHILNKICNKIYIINGKIEYPFKYTNQLLQNNEIIDNNIQTNDTNFDSFDYIKYNQITKQQLTKKQAWKQYIKSNINLSLTIIDISYINALINILNIGISKNYTELLIIIDDNTPNISNINYLYNNLTKYEYITASLLITSVKKNINDNETIIENNNADIVLVTTIHNITSFIIRNSLFLELFTLLINKNISWQACISQLIDKNKFKCYQLNSHLF